MQGKLLHRGVQGGLDLILRAAGLELAQPLDLLALDAFSSDSVPMHLMTREAFENAISVIMAVGGSTNAVLHLLAIARTASVPLTIDDFETIRQRVPVICDLKPSGRFVTTDLHAAGGIPPGDEAAARCGPAPW